MPDKQEVRALQKPAEMGRAILAEQEVGKGKEKFQ